MNNSITMEARGNEFKMCTEKHESGSRCVLYRIVSGVEHLVKEIDSYKDGAEYIRDQYSSDWDKFTLFADTLHDELRDQMYLLHYEPYSTIPTQRQITIDGITSKLFLVVKCEDDFISSVKVDKIEVLDPEMKELCEYFETEFYSIVSQAFNLALA